MDSESKKVAITEPLNSSDEKQETTREMFHKISKLAIFPIIGMIFHPAYTICNTIIFREDKEMQKALGFGGLSLSLFLLALGVTFNGSLDTLIPQAYGQKDLRLCRVYLNRQLYLTTLVFLPLAVPLLLIKEALLGIG